MTQKKKPVLRFKGFTDDWEQRKLGELAEFNPKASLPDSFEYVDLESVVGTRIINHRTEKKDSAPSRAQRLAQPGDVFYQTVRPYQRNNCLFTGAEKSYVFSTGYAQLRSHGDSYFLLTMLQKDDFVNSVMDRCTGTSYPAINSNELAEINVIFPTIIQEQKELGQFFKNIDNLITLHQRKYEKLRNLKKFFLEKIFPQNGKRVPEVRFAGFTGDWEQRKIFELFKITRGHVLASPLISDTKTGDKPYPVFSSQTKNNGLMGYYKDYLYQDAITWTTDGANAGTVNYRAEKFYCTNVCGVLLADKVIPNQMIAEALNKVAKRHVSYVGNPKLMNNVMADIEITLPDDENEQKRISYLFDKIDNLITLHQRKLEKLQNLKKAALDKMFV